MSTSTGDPSNKMPWYRSMRAKFRHAEKLELLNKREAAKKEGKGKKNKKDLTTTENSAKV